MIRKTISALALLIAFALGCNAQIAYKIEGNGLKAPAVIFGTHHLAPLSTIDNVAGAKEAFENATQIVGEVDMTQDQMALAQTLQSHMMAPADSTLRNVIPADLWNSLNDTFKKYAPMPGMDLDMLNAMKPMLVNTMVAVKMVQEDMPDYDPSQQLDTYFMTTAKAAGKKIAALETVEEQATYLYDRTPIAKQAKALIEMLQDPQKQADSAKKLNNAYARQDLQALLALTEAEDEDPMFLEMLLNERNANWIKKLPAIIAEQPTFIAVGALHLPGEKGVLKGLENAGYTVTPLK